MRGKSSEMGRPPELEMAAIPKIMAKDFAIIIPSRRKLLRLFGASVAAFIMTAAIAFIAGWAGILDASVFGILFWPACVLAGVFSGISMALDFNSRPRFAALELGCAIVCLCVGLYFCFYVRHNPFKYAFEMRLKHEYLNKVGNIQNWAISILDAKHTSFVLGDSDSISVLNINDFPSALVTCSNDDNLEGHGSISLSWSNGMGGTWGVIVGRNNLALKEDKLANGFYFFDL